MKKTKLVSTILSLVLICSLMTGCVGNVGEITLNKDGSGTITMSAGFTKDVLDMMSSMGEPTEGSTDIEDLKPFTYNGITYYGETETVSFKSVEEFNTLINETGDEEDPTNVDNGVFELIKNADGSFALKLFATTDTGDTSEMEENANMQLDISEEELELMMSQMAVVFEINFPDNVYQINGGIDGVKIDGKKLTLDFIEMGKHITKDTVYLFSTNPNEAKLSTFIDVPSTFWGYEAVEALAKGGLVAGIGDNKFNPNGDITYAQFCQIASRALGYETGADDTGYWAAKAVKSCLEHNIILNRGEVNSKNYDVPMTREAAVSSMYLIAKDKFDVIKRNIFESDIPDYSQISEEYRYNVLLAYNAGITSGVDSNRTFLPKSHLTRAQICQLFYNLDITSINGTVENVVKLPMEDRVLITKEKADKLELGMTYDEIAKILGKDGLLVSFGAYQDAATNNNEKEVVNEVVEYYKNKTEFDLNNEIDNYIKEYNIKNPDKMINSIEDLCFKITWNDFENNFTYTEKGLYYGAEVTVYFHYDEAFMILTNIYN